MLSWKRLAGAEPNLPHPGHFWQCLVYSAHLVFYVAAGWGNIRQETKCRVAASGWNDDFAA